MTSSMIRLDRPRRSRRPTQPPAPIGILLCLSLLACAHHPSGTTVTSAGGEVAGTSGGHWTAAINPLTTTSSVVSGRADISAGANGLATVMLVLTGLEPGDSYVWHIRRGPCTGQEPQGPPSEYAPLSVNAGGRGTAAGTFPLADVQSLHDYHIDIRPAQGEPIACGTITTAASR
jgi:hypothetical protein